MGGGWQLNECNRVSTYVSSLKGLNDSRIPQEEETKSHVDGAHSAEMKQSGSSYLAPLIDCTKVDGDSDFDIINNKTRRKEAKEQTELRDDHDAKTDDDEV